MEYLETAREIVATLGGAGTVIALVILWQAGLLKNPWAKKEATEPVVISEKAKENLDNPTLAIMENLQTSFSKLQHHFNDETTAVLTGIQVNLGKIGTNQESMHDSLKDIQTSLDKILQDGVRIRN